MNDFINPASMAAGVALVSAPILIHLINRMRFKRIRWAAMEFLLKAQKRMRRKMIIEQLLLLFLRCLMVFLLGLLVGRFFGCSPDGVDKRQTMHVVILDDSPSMADGWTDNNASTTAFDQAKKVVTEQIAASAAQATTAQTMEVLRLSDLGSPISAGRLNATTIEELGTKLKAVGPSPVRVSVADGLKRAKELFAAQGTTDTAQVVHVVSDFRETDWQRDGEPIKQMIQELTAAKVKVHLTDVVHPFRKPDERKTLLSHDNVGITEFRAERAITARDQPVKFVLKVKNYGVSELKDQRFSIWLNGVENTSVSFATLPPNVEVEQQVLLTFHRAGSEDKPLDRFSLVMAKLEAPENGGIAVDNVRYALIEVRDRLPILIVEGRPNLRDKKEGDSFYLRRIFTGVLGGYQIDNALPGDLATKDLRPYVGVFLMNVGSVPDAGAANLEKYVREGGGVGVFLGPDVSPKDYNKNLYADGNGLFPVPLPERPSEPLTEEQKSAKLYNFQKKFLLRDPSAKQHPALRELYLDERGRPVRDDKFDNQLLFFTINQYWPVKRIGKWRDDRAVTELYCMPNEQPMSNFDTSVNQLHTMLTELFTDAELEKYKKVVLDEQSTGVRRLSLQNEPVFKLAAALDRMLSDQRGEGDATEAVLREFWANPKAGDARTLAMQIRDSAKYGDPIYLAKRLGRGRVTAFLSTGGEQWTDWPTGAGGGSYVPIISEMEKFLSGGGADDNLKVGETIEFRVDEANYLKTVKRAFVTHDPAKTGPKGGTADPAPVVDLKAQDMVPQEGKFVFRFTDDKQPGGYLFTLTTLKGQVGGANVPAEEPEYRGVAANVDTAREGDLRRATNDDIKTNSPNAELHSLDDATWLDKIKQKQTDLSESGWMFLLLLLLLIAEQALAVRLSYHASPSELESTAPSAAAAMHTSSNRTAAEPTPAA